jgi:hypothetical protein
MESKIEKIENFLNGTVNFTSEKFIRHKDNLEIMIGLITKPHEMDSRVKWEPIP